MINVIPSASVRRKIATVGLAAATLAAAMGSACAQQGPWLRYNQEFGLYQGNYTNPAVQASPSRTDRAGFDRSGTRGREGLGATPAHPEGPGGVSN
ncbi:MAG TPA: hypothetical protein VL996_11725 [Methylocella sp.]|nr:hypothetical protein [Methylocella sp.]